MVIGFKQQFVLPILSGIKVHTIRTDPKHRWRPGMVMHMATGVRTKDYEQFYQATCKSIQEIDIHYSLSGKIIVRIDGHPITTTATMLNLAQNDGFLTIPDFFKWFNTSYKGYIIHWTNLVYNCRKAEYQQASLFQP